MAVERLGHQGQGSILQSTSTARRGAFTDGQTPVELQTDPPVRAGVFEGRGGAGSPASAIQRAFGSRAAFHGRTWGEVAYGRPRPRALHWPDAIAVIDTTDPRAVRRHPRVVRDRLFTLEKVKGKGKFMPTGSSIATLVKQGSKDLKADWLKCLAGGGGSAEGGRISEAELDRQTGEFLDLLVGATQGGGTDISSPAYKGLREFLEGVSKSRAQQGFSSSETARFIFSFKQPLFRALQLEAGTDAQRLVKDTWAASELVDALGLHTMKAFQITREDVIRRQQEEMLELSTPVVKLWDGILALPMIGTLDSARTQVVMESLLNRIVETGSEMAIIDITGVPTVDTLVAQHLLKTVTALRLMGADCIISGVRPQIAQTIVHLGVDLQGVTTKANLADALSLALKRSGFTVSRT
jgi:rsbT co-antagonist protein RsbR